MLPIRVILNLLLSKYDRVQVLFIGAGLAGIIRLLRVLLKLFRGRLHVKESIIAAFVKLFRQLPRVHAEIESQKSKARQSIESSILVESGVVTEELPAFGVSMENLLSLLDEKSVSEKRNWINGNLTGAVYNTSADLEKIHACALSRFGKANLLHPDIFVYTRQMEAELIRMTLKMLSGDSSEFCGSVTSGGTESILLAVKAYRDYAFSVKGVSEPNMVIPSTAHAAFVKASEYFRIELRRCLVDPDRYYEANLSHMHSLIDSNTIMLVASSPQFPHGTMDPVPAIAKMALNYSIPCHVDACLGSLLLPFLSLPYEYDFKVAGVTSISCDTHKYGFAPKGTSVLMYRNSQFRKYQYSVCTDWEGGLYATPTISGSRCSGPVVAAWASMMFMGRDGYMQSANRIHNGAKLIEQSILANPELQMLGRVDTSVVSFTAHTLNILDIAEWMKKNTTRKWTLAILQNPIGVHFAVTMANVENCHEFIADLTNAVKLGHKGGKSDTASIYGSAATVPKTLVNELVVDYLDTCYRTACTANDNT